jgi:hypothetical protein
MRNNDKKFIQFVKDECKRYGIKCDLRNTKYVKLYNTINCAGWFDSDNKKLVVAMNRPDALSILVHEYAHLTQWRDSLINKCELWSKSSVSLNRVEAWLSGKRIRDIKHHLSINRDLELDNEKRTVKLIRKHGLSINVADYTRRANAYVQSYNWLYYTRRWSSPGNSPYTNEIIINAVSDKFNMRYDRMSNKVYNAFYAANI